MIKNWIFALIFAMSVGGGTLATLASEPSLAGAPTNNTCAKAQKLLTFPVWYRGLNVGKSGSDSDCQLTSPSAVGGLSNFIWRIVLNVTEIGLQLVGYISVGYILYGGFLFLTSQGSSEGSAKARKTILNAVIGLVISIASIAIVNLTLGVFK